MTVGDDRLAGRTALVTGAGNGLGRAIALRLAASSAAIVAVGRRPEPLEEIVAQIRSRGGTARAVVADVSDPESVATLRARVDDHVSILVNNAGVPGPVRSLVDIEPAEWDEVFATNVRGVFLVCRAFAPAMVERRCGEIVNLASVSGKRPLVGRTPYCASKAAVIALSTTLAAELGPSGVRVNTLSPGPVRGPRMERNFQLEARRTGTSPEQAEQAYVARASLGRMIEEDEVAEAVVAMVQMTGLHAADIDLSAGMVAR